MTAYRIISGDSHFVEPPTIWAERIDKKFRDRAPHTVQGHKGQEGEFFVEIGRASCRERVSFLV